MSIQSVDEYIKDNFISKEKIRNRIKELNKQQERCFGVEDVNILEMKIISLEELLAAEEQSKEE